MVHFDAFIGDRQFVVVIVNQSNGSGPCMGSTKPLEIQKSFIFSS